MSLLLVVILAGCGKKEELAVNNDDKAEETVETKTPEEVSENRTDEAAKEPHPRV